MSTDAKAHLKKEALVGGISNAIFNGWIAWLLLRGGPELGWGGNNSFVIDVLATAFLLPLIVALIVIPLQRRKLASGALQPMILESDSVIRLLADMFPGRLFYCSLLFGLTGLLVLAPLTLVCIYVAGVESFTPAAYALFKGVWAGLLAGALVVLMVVVALRQPADARR